MEKQDLCKDGATAGGETFILSLFTSFYFSSFVSYLYLQ